MFEVLSFERAFFGVLTHHSSLNRPHPAFSVAVLDSATPDGRRGAGWFGPE